MRGILPWLVLGIVGIVGLLGVAGSAAANDGDCVGAASAAEACALEEGRTVYNYGGVFRDDRWNHVARASASQPEGSAAARVGQGFHYDSLYYCNWGCTRVWNQRDATEANATASDGLGRTRVFAGQEEGFSYYSSGGTTRYWEYKTTGAHASRSVGDRTVEVGAGQTATRSYGPGSPYAEACGTGAYARLDGRDPLGLPTAPCSVAGQDLRVPQLYGYCRTVQGSAVCTRLPDWPDGTGLPFL